MRVERLIELRYLASSMLSRRVSRARFWLPDSDLWEVGQPRLQRQQQVVSSAFPDLVQPVESHGPFQRESARRYAPQGCDMAVAAEGTRCDVIVCMPMIDCSNEATVVRPAFTGQYPTAHKSKCTPKCVFLTGDTVTYGRK